MKKLMIVAAAAALGFTACTVNDIIVDQHENTAIDFGTYIGQSQTKAGENYMTADNIMYMSVSAHHTGQNTWEDFVTGEDNNKAVPASTEALPVPNFMKDQFVFRTVVKNDEGTVTSDTWGYTPIKYWPGNDKLSFFAVSTNSVNVAQGEAVKLEDGYKYTFNQPAGLDGQVDLLHASALDVYKGGGTASPKHDNMTAEGKITFKFDHTLSRIGFSAISGLTEENGGKYTRMQINSIVFGSSAETTILPSNKLNVITTDGKFSWETVDALPTTDDAAKISYTLGSTSDFSDAGKTELPNTTTDPKTAPVNINAEDKYFMILPWNYQTNTKSIPVEVTYTVNVYADPANASGPLVKVTSYENTAKFTVSEKFAPKTAYRIKLIVTPDAIEFGGMDVTAWHTAADGDNPEQEITATK